MGRVRDIIILQGTMVPGVSGWISFFHIPHRGYFLTTSWPRTAKVKAVVMSRRAWCFGRKSTRKHRTEFSVDPERSGRGGGDKFCPDRKSNSDHSVCSQCFTDCTLPARETSLCAEEFNLNVGFTTSCSYTMVPRGGAVGWGKLLQVGRSRFRLSIVSLKFIIDIILPAALWPWGWLSLWQKWVTGIFHRG